MKLKISILLIAALAWSLCSEAQTARNPLNFEPARVTLQKGLSSWKLAETIFYRANDKPFDKQSFQYDENGRKTTELTFRLNETDQTWHQTMKSEYRYFDGKEIIMNMSGTHYTSRTEVVYDTENKPLYSFTYSWNSDAGDWSVNPFLRSEWKYDANGSVTTCLKQQINRTTNEWNDFDVRILYTYHENGALTEELFQILNIEQGQWTNRGKYSYSKINELQKVAISYVYASGSWVFDGKTVYIYDEDGKIARSEYYKNEVDKTPDAYSINTYSEIAGFPEEVESKEITVFPNPAVSSFELTVPNEYTGKTMYLFDAWGKQVKAVQVTGQTMQVDVSGLPGGVYLLRIGELSKKIVLK